MLAIIFIEYCVSTRWFPVYFKFGIPIYNKRFTGKASILSGIDDSHLNSVSKSFVLSFVTPLIFKEITVGLWALHQKSFRASMMHGKLLVEQGNSNFHLVGYINWWILILVILVMKISLERKELFPFSAIAIMFLLFYFLERHMYNRLANYLSEEKK